MCAETVLVTAALGGAGSWIVDRLRVTYDVVTVGQTLPTSGNINGVDFRAVSLIDQGVVWETVLDADPTAVVNFDNISHEEDHAGGEVCENNAASTYHTFEAAGQTGARVVWTSSEPVYGTHWSEPPLPSYFPVDKDSPSPHGMGTRLLNSPAR